MVSATGKTEVEAIVGSQFPKIVIPKIDNAKKSIKIIVFDWRWYPNDSGNPCQLFNQSIVRASRRGVRVRVITNYTDVVATLKSVGVDARKIVTKNLVHAKMMLIDDETLILGSHNYTQSAFTMNFEVSVAIKDAEAIAEFVKYFNSFV